MHKTGSKYYLIIHKQLFKIEISTVQHKLCNIKM